MPDKYRLTRRAEADLEDIFEYTLRMWGAAQAESYVRKILQSFDRLASQPNMGRLREEIAPPVRLLHVERHLVIYRSIDVGIEVIAVTHDRRNWRALGLFGD